MYEIEKFISLPAENIRSQIRAIGIDLGTTNSTVSEVVWEPGNAPVCTVLELSQQTQAGEYISPLVPSVVIERPNNQIWIGEGAKRLRAFLQKANLIHEMNLFYDTKNDMGLRKTYYRAPERQNHAYKIAGLILLFLKTGPFFTHQGEKIWHESPTQEVPQKKRQTLSTGNANESESSCSKTVTGMPRN